MANPLFAPLLRWLATLRFPKLFMVIAGLFVVDLAIPNFIPWDDIFLGLATLLLARWKTHRSTKAEVGSNRDGTGR
ncbi:MAG TPA: DUF6116 family protein [Luteimonas sp.]|jgi:hypothetical protein|nr:DUF6116 family protein [Luteimonas sp.]